MPGADRQGTLAGLTSAEAALRLRQWGPNVLAPARRFETARQIAGWLGSPLVLILLVASAISAALGQHAGSVVIAFMVVLGGGLNATQAYRSQAAAKRPDGSWRKRKKTALGEVQRPRGKCSSASGQPNVSRSCFMSCGRSNRSTVGRGSTVLVVGIRFA